MTAHNISELNSRISPCIRTIPGAFHIDNFGSVDIGWHGLLACGSQNMVMILDPVSVQLLQAYEIHKTNVIKVKWCQDDLQHDATKHHCCKLAAADSQGKIAIFDANEASVTSEFGDGSKSLVRDLQWIHYESSATELLLALHAPGDLVLWNGITGIKLWSKTYNDILLSFVLDPFDSSNIIFRGRHSLVMIKDFSVSKMPASSGKRFHISTPASGGAHSEIPTKKTRSSQIFKATTKLMTGEFLLGGLSDKSELPRSTSADAISSIASLDCNQLLFHGYLRNHLIVAYPREVLIIDLMIYQTVSTFSTEKNSSCFVQLYSCRQRNLIYCLHENGAFSIRYGHYNEETELWTYDMVCQGESIRLSRQIKLIGMAVNPANERTLALVTSDSHIQFWSLKIHKALGETKLKMKACHQNSSLADSLHPDVAYCQTQQKKVGKPCQLKLIISGLWSGTTVVPTVVRMSPPLTKSNLSFYKPLLAVANNRGSVQVWDLETGILRREFALLTCPILGLEWTSMHSLIVNGYLLHSSTLAGQSPKVKNEMISLDLNSGQITPFRNHPDNETPIDFIRVSYLKQYLAIGFRDKPVEIWDIQTLLPIKELPASSPRIVTMEWLPQRSQRKCAALSEENGPSDKTLSTSPTEKENQNKLHLKESMVATDTDGLIYLYAVEGTFITEATKVSRDTGLSKVSAVIWKNDRLVIGDVESNIIFWNLREKSPKGIPSQKGPVRKMKFAPGSGNFRMFVLYHDTIDIWDAKTVTLISSKSIAPTLPHLVDADWATSDKPLICTADGCLKVMDCDLKASCCSVEDDNFADPITCFSLLPSKVSSTIHYLLQNQPWSKDNEMNITVCPSLGEGFEKVADNVSKVLKHLPPHARDFVKETNDLIERCHFVAQIFGNEYEVKFWNIVRYNLHPNKADFMLDCPYDILSDHELYKAFQNTRLKVLEKKRCTYWQSQRCATALLMTGHSDRAVKLLLETPPTSDNYLLDMHKACLVSNTSAQNSSVSSESTLKLVATNLISNNNLWEGAQLLCMIGKYADACRYLESFGEWNTAVWLAKCTLPPQETVDILLRWSTYLATPQVNQKSQSVLILLSLREHQKVLEMLYGMRQFQLAARYLEVCEKHSLVDMETMTSLSNAIYLECARHMMSLGNKESAIYYCDRAGEKGKQLKQEVEFMLSG